MPADTKAISYEWYMVMNVDEQIIRLVWDPEGGEIVSSMTLGMVQFQTRDEITEEWKAITDWAGPLPFAAAEGYARREGFTVENPIYK